MAEPIREQFLDRMVTVVSMALATGYTWGTFPPTTVWRSYQPLVNLGDRLRVFVLDGDFSFSPRPDQHDGAFDDRFSIDILIQVAGDSETPASRWGNRALDAIKRAIADGTQAHGLLYPLTKLRVQFEDEGAVHQVGDRAEFILPCTALLPENLGPFQED